MKLVRVEEKKVTHLIPLGDVHVGSLDFDKDKFEETVKWIKQNKDVRVVLMGDLIDAGLRDSVGGGNFDNDITPEDQIDYVVDILKPIKNQIWCMLTGNHEERVRQKTSIDVSKLIAKALDVKYVGPSCFIKAKIGDINYIIYALHGSSGSLTPSGKLNAVLKSGGFTNSDLTIMGHVHELMNHTTEYFRVDIGNKMIIKDKRHYVLTGHFLKYGGYAQHKNMAPGKSGVANIRLNNKVKDIHISL
jgi:hypothetical protein